VLVVVKSKKVVGQNPDLKLFLQSTNGIPGKCCCACMASTYLGGG
jgi:hypothetical protein